MGLKTRIDALKNSEKYSLQVDNNWNPNCLPTLMNDVIIPSATNSPLISAAQLGLAKSVSVEANGKLTIQNGGELMIDTHTFIIDQMAELSIELGAKLNVQ